MEVLESWNEVAKQGFSCSRREKKRGGGRGEFEMPGR